LGRGKGHGGGDEADREKNEKTLLEHWESPFRNELSTPMNGIISRKLCEGQDSDKSLHNFTKR
jgi:hypothetical protein